MVDAPMGAAEEIPEFLEQAGRKLSGILLTHGHWDHIWDAGELALATGAKIYASKFGTTLIEDADFQREVMFADDGLRSSKIDVKVSDGDILKIAGLEIKCFEVFGHSPDSIAYFISEGGAGVFASVCDGRAADYVFEYVSEISFGEGLPAFDKKYFSIDAVERADFGCDKFARGYPIWTQK